MKNHTEKHGDNQQSIVAGLNFEITPGSFSNGRLVVTCRADVFHLYNEQAEISLLEERPRLASVLGTRESSHISSTGKFNGEWFHAGLIVAMSLWSLR